MGLASLCFTNSYEAAEKRGNLVTSYRIQLSDTLVILFGFRLHTTEGLALMLYIFSVVIYVSHYNLDPEYVCLIGNNSVLHLLSTF